MKGDYSEEGYLRQHLKEAGNSGQKLLPEPSHSMMTRYEEKQEDITLNKDFKKAICLITDKDTKIRK